uniref:Uncharacterized protein n=1 Tax=Vitis vinifera TaxID=29760 RepID=F6HGF9_VITVI
MKELAHSKPSLFPHHFPTFLPLMPMLGSIVLCVIGDVSFLYDTNGLSILSQSMKHLEVRTKIELQDALFTSQQENRDCVIEVESCIDSNAAFHSHRAFLKN